jgi:hypothetical protein
MTVTLVQFRHRENGTVRVSMFPSKTTFQAAVSFDLTPAAFSEFSEKMSVQGVTFKEVL